jgi:hypothetical protein
MLSQKTTTSGGVTGKGDSSRPCCSRTAGAVEQRSPKRARKASSMAPGTGRGSTAGIAWLGSGAFMAIVS